MADQGWSGSVLNIFIFAYPFGDVSGAEITHFSLKTLRLEIQNTPIKASRANQKTQSEKYSSTLRVNSLRNSAHHPLTKQKNTGNILTENRNSDEYKTHLYKGNHEYQHIAVQTIHFINDL